ncbi:MAG: DedD protein [Paraglaciecola sp.]
MASSLQNRLVGTIILVAVAVIFLPDLLDAKKQSNGNLLVELPQKPAMDKVTRAETFDTEKVRQASIRKIEIINEKALDDTAAGQDVAVPVEQKITETPSVELPTVQKNSLEQETIVEEDQQRLLASAGWVVQLGSFRHQKNVRELLGKLEKGGYRAFSRQVQTKSGELTKVFVGPDLQKEKLENAISHLKELTNLQGRVTPFTVQ